MKKLVSVLAVFLFTTLAYSQNTFWIVKGGTGDEAQYHASSQLDTTAGGNLLWLYNSNSTPTGVRNIVMEVWPKGSTNPSSELLLVAPYDNLIHNMQVYDDEIYLSAAVLTATTNPDSRAGLIRLDTNGVFISSFSHNGSQMGNYGNAYKCLFLQDTAFVFGQARSSAGSGNREDFYWAKIDLNNNSSLDAKRWNGFGTERIRDAVATQKGDSVFAAAYSYSHPSNTRPVLFHFDKAGNIVQQSYYLLPAPTWGNYSGSFSKIVSKSTDSLIALGGLGSNSLLRVPMGLDGQPGPSLYYGGSNAGVGVRIRGYQPYGNQLLIYGYLQNESMGNGGDEGFLMLLDSDGNVLWAKMYGGSGDEEITDLQVTADGFYMTGKTNSSSQGGWDVMLLKTDFNGDIAQVSPCFSIIPYTAFVNTTSVTPTRVNFSASNSGALSVLSSPALSILPSTDIFDDNCNVLGWQSESDSETSLIEETEFKAFPNPFGQRLSIELAGPTEQLNLALLDQVGRIVHQENINLSGATKHECSLPHLAAGAYVLRVHAYHEGQMQTYQKTLLHR